MSRPGTHLDSVIWDFLNIQKCTSSSRTIPLHSGVKGTTWLASKLLSLWQSSEKKKEERKKLSRARCMCLILNIERQKLRRSASEQSANHPPTALSYLLSTRNTSESFAENRQDVSGHVPCLQNKHASLYTFFKSAYLSRRIKVNHEFGQNECKHFN